MKLIQINGWLGYLMYPLLEFIAREQPDFVCMQEVLSTDHPNRLYTNYSLLEEVIKAGGFEHHAFAPTYTFESFGDKVQLGNAIFSKLPIETSKTIFIAGKYNSNQVNRNFITNIRNLLACKISSPNRPFWITTHHGYHDVSPLGAPDTLMYSQKAAQALLALPQDEPRLFCADLNITTDSPAFEPYQQLGMTNVVAEHKVPTTLSSVHRAPQWQKDSVACDHILVSPAVTVTSFEVSEALVSDHKALILEFDC